MTAPGLSVVVSIRATTFFGAVAGDRVFLSLVFQHLFIIHRSSAYHSFEPATTTFCSAVPGDRVFLSLVFSTSFHHSPSHLSSLS